MPASCHRVFVALALIATSSFTAAQEPGLPVTIAWDANSEPGVVGYRVYVGAAPSVYAETFDAGNATSFTYRHGVAGRRYYFAVAAYVASSLEGPRSSEVSTVVASATSTPSASEPLPPPASEPPPPGSEPAPPGGDGGGDSLPPDDGGDGGTPPGNESTPGIVLDPPVVRGRTVTFTWRASGELALINYLLEVGSSRGASDVYNAPVGTETSFSATVLNGSYFARVRARLPDDESVLSNEVGFSVGAGACSAVPKTPRGVAARVTAGIASITWKTAARATSYVVQVGTAPGHSDLFNHDVGATRSVAAEVSTAAALYVRVVAVNACGQSAASEEVRVQ
jgi:hypothetical protein